MNNLKYLSLLFLLLSPFSFASENSKANDTLLSACYYGEFLLVKQALNDGADINTRNHYDQTPLHYAALRGHIRIVSFLLEAGADYKIKGTYNKTAHDWAVMHGHKKIVIMLKKWPKQVERAKREGTKPRTSDPI